MKKLILAFALVIASNIAQAGATQLCTIQEVRNNIVQGFSQSMLMFSADESENTRVCAEFAFQKGLSLTVDEDGREIPGRKVIFKLEKVGVYHR